MMSTPFVILFQGRSGSTFLIEALASHPSVVARGEVLIVLKASGARTQIEWTRQYFTRDLPSSCAAFGFKAKLVDVLDPTSFASVLRAAQCRIVHLDRANVVKQVISWIRADILFERTADWNVYARTHKVPAIALSVDDVMARLRAIEHGRRDLKKYAHSLQLPICTVYYEQLFVEPEPQFRRLLQFLGVPPRPLRSLCLKNTDDDLQLVVPNFMELRAALVGTPYEAMCNEVLVPS